MSKKTISQEKNTMDLDRIKKIIDLFEKKDISELSLEQGDLKIKLKKNSHTPNSTSLAPPIVLPAQPQTTEEKSTDENNQKNNYHTIKSPMVGTFYKASSPTAEPYIKKGDIVESEQVICIIEAMKIMNEIESDIKGRVEAILVDNGHPVEYGEPLILIEPL